MITKETCVKIWSCYDEISKAKKILKDMATNIQKDEEKKTPTLSNAFGERHGLQLGIPCGDDSHRLFGVPPKLAVEVVEAHIKKQQLRLEELQAIAKIELYGEATPVINLNTDKYACMLSEMDSAECRAANNDCSKCKWGKEIR
ncbi:hypothetical protein OU798_07580 [Prolixibacteraceae bacterium Z1-6]|uniref:Uncharacterized protein n=1 Tax=Draconibacterium aestuarii TaxID=2998507 RepID=A0A9X3F4A7_9BACT|nr:hypothetical protein [Prolixibacteraceae bacterium Z1-6]